MPPVKTKWTYYILAFLAFSGFSCGTGNKEEASTNAVLIPVPTDSPHRDSFQLKESFNEEDAPVNEHLSDRLKPIRENFKRINSITNWTSIDTLELSTGEGGEARYYYQNGLLEKIITRQFGETFQQLTEYYLLKGALSFVFERSYRYNRPIYYDSAAMKAQNDTETFDPRKSGIVEDRSYFENGRLFYQVNNEDCGSPFSQEYLQEEEKRIKADLESIMELIKINLNGGGDIGGRFVDLSSHF